MPLARVEARISTPLDSASPPPKRLTKDASDAQLREAADANATFRKPGRDDFWSGYSGYFVDLDGHLWEVAWNPNWEFEEA